MGVVTTAGGLERGAMASSRVMASASSAGSDVARQSSLYSVGRLAGLSGDRRGSNAGSTNVEDLLRNFYAESPAGDAAMGDENSPYVGVARAVQDGAGSGGSGKEVTLSQQERLSAPRVASRRTAEEVWEEISRDRKVDVGAERVYKEEFENITLEDFLARAGAVTVDDSPSAPVLLPPQVEGAMLGFAADASMADRYAQQNQQVLLADGQFSGFGNGADSGGVGRGKRKLLADTVDRASQQKQKRMIKNRESAARSRERKQVRALFLAKLLIGKINVSIRLHELVPEAIFDMKFIVPDFLFFWVTCRLTFSNLKHWQQG